MRTDEELFEKLKSKSIKDLESLCRRLKVDAYPYRSKYRKVDLIDAIWFSADNEYPRSRLIEVLYGRKHKKNRRKKHVHKRRVKSKKRVKHGKVKRRKRHKKIKKKKTRKKSKAQGR